MSSRILDVVQVRFLATREIGTSGNYETVVFDISIGDEIEGVVVERMKHFVGEGVYLQNEEVGVLFVPEQFVYGSFVSDENSVPFAKKTGARY
jgi:hypothetical protein